MYGFTLVELLIAMTLTAVIGMVLFSTYSMVMDNGKTVRNRVLERESERVFWGILDNDIAGLCLIDDKRSTLPPLSVSRLSRPTRSTASPKRTSRSPPTTKCCCPSPPVRIWRTCRHPLARPGMRGIRPAQRQPFRRLHPGASGPTAAWKATFRGPSWCLSAM